MFITSTFRSNHFSDSEFRCKGSGKVKVHIDLLDILEDLRYKLEAPIIITSGYRSPEYNASIGGAPNSYHVKGMAADIKTTTPEKMKELQALIEADDRIKGIGYYKSWYHIDVRDQNHRVTWDLR